MQEQLIRFFDQKTSGSAMVLATHGFLKNNGFYPMGGKGHLAESRKVFRGIDKRIATALEKQGRPRGKQGLDVRAGLHVVQIFDRPMIFSMPVKYGFWEDADLQLVDDMSLELRALVDVLKLPQVYMYPFGDGTPWSEIVSILRRNLDNRFVMCAAESD